MPGRSAARVASPTVVGREVELAHLRTCLVSAAEGHPRVVVVGGDAGIGKSRLVAEAAREAREDRVRVLLGSCLAMGSGIPYLPVLEIVRSLSRQGSDLAVARIPVAIRTQLRMLVPDLQVGAAGTSGTDPFGRQTSAHRRDAPEHPTPAPGPLTQMGSGLARLGLYDAVLRFLAHLAAESPTLVVVEDIQWSDEATLALLAFLVHNLHQERLAIVLTVRSSEASGPSLAFLSDVERSHLVDRIELTELSLDATRRQMAGILGSEPDQGLVARIHDLGGGNPFFAEELLALGDVPTDGSGTWSPRLRDVLRARLARLSGDTVDVLAIAAAAGRSVDEGLLAAATGLDRERVEGAVREALAEQILVAEGSGPSAGCRFRHDLVRAFVSESLPPAQRARLHGSFARALASRHVDGDRPAELAYHWDAAGEAARAYSAHVDAGLAAEGAYAFPDADRHFERALELWDEVPDADDRSSLDWPHLAQRAADAAAQSGRLERAIELARAILSWGEARDPDGAAPEPALMAYVRSSLRWHLWRAGRIDEALAEAEAAVEHMAHDGDRRWYANALAHHAGLLMLSGQRGAARRRAREAGEVALAAGALEEAALAEGVRGWCLVLDGDLDEGIERIRLVHDLARASSPAHLTGIALAGSQLVAALEYSGRLEEAIACAREARDWVARHGMGRTVGARLAAAEARCLYLVGRWREASDVLDEACAGGPVGSGRADLAVARALLVAAGGPAGSGGHDVGDAIALVDAAPGHGSWGWLEAARAERWLWAGDTAAARDALLRSFAPITPASQQDGQDGAPEGPRRTFEHPVEASLPYRVALAAWASAETSLRQRAARAERAARAARGPGAEPPGDEPVRAQLRRLERDCPLAAAWRAEVLTARAELTRDGSTAAGERAHAWERAAGAASGRRPYLEARARWRLAEALASAGGGRTRAAAEADRARSLADDLVAAHVIEELEHLVRSARLAPRGAAARDAEAQGAGGEHEPEAGPFGLTVRELEVLELLAQGLSNPDIGSRLFISPRTASVHVSNILGKLGVSSRVEAATLALRLGLSERHGDRTAG